MNNEFLGDRRRALEEEYFAKLNRALLERLRASEAADPKAGEAKAGDADSRSEVDGGASSDHLAEEAY